MSSFLSFHLSDQFVAKYEDKPIPWGFDIGGGNSLGETVFYTNYSRVKADGTKERWPEVCRRVVEGMYSILKDHCLQQRTPWNHNKAQRSAEEAYDRLFHLQWTPPGRGLWCMGTELVNGEKNSAALQNCFAGNEMFLCREYGVVTFEEVVGQDVHVWHDGSWHLALVRSFGSQTVQDVTFGPARDERRGYGFYRSNVGHTIRTTPEHGWVLVDGTVTRNLSVGDVVAADAAGYDDRSAAYVEGVRHGLVFGDGVKITHRYANGDYGFELRVCDERSAKVIDQLAISFDKSYDRASANGDVIYAIRTPVDLKKVPTGQYSADYTAGFIYGWATADARIRPTADTWQITSQNSEAVGWLRSHAASGGWVVTGHSVASNRETNFGPRKNPLHEVTIRPADRCFWKVRSITPLPEEEEVYCVTVPGVSRFTLAAGISTMNCGVLSTQSLTVRDPGLLFGRLMDMSMHGIGIGFDTLGAGGLVIQEPAEGFFDFQVPDTREGWVESIDILLQSFLKPGRALARFDYSLIRPQGAPLKRFGGFASGPDPLREVHETIVRLLSGRSGELVTTRDITDIFNLVGKCVVAGGARRSAELALGQPDDTDFISLKNWSLPENAERTGADGWSWLSNNSVEANVAGDYSHLVDGIVLNGEPGLVYLDMCRAYGRLKDGVNNKDHRVAGVNPCLTADTLIAVADGRGAVPIGTLAAEGVDVPVYTANKHGGVSVRTMRNPRVTGFDQDIFRITFDDGSSIDATSNHTFIMLDGSEKKLQDLSHGDALYSLSRKLDKFVAGTSGGDYWQLKTSSSGWRHEHRVMAQYYTPDMPHSWVVHHADFDSTNNDPANLVPMDPEAHRRLHADRMIGDCNPVARGLRGEFGQQWISDYSKSRSVASSGESNPNYSDASAAAIWEAMESFTSVLGHKPSVKSWQKHAATLGLPGQFSEWRSEQMGGSVDECLRIAAERVGVFGGDPRRAAYIKSLRSQGYEVDASGPGKPKVLRSCETCKTGFWTTTREAAYCSTGCLNKARDYSANVAGLRSHFSTKQADTRNQQVDIFLDLRLELGRPPLRKEWAAACKEAAVSAEVSRESSPFKSWSELQEAALVRNHRVISVEYIGKQDVFNGTVDDTHTFFAAGPNGFNNSFVLSKNCGEQTLEHWELCTLVEVHLPNHSDLEDFKRSLKFAYLYGKAVTLLPTHWPETNEVMTRNRRIGTSITGIVQFIEENHSIPELRSWLDSGYDEVTNWDVRYSEWLGVRESIKRTSVKPSGSVSLLSGVTPGAHWPVAAGRYFRRQRLAITHPMVAVLRAAGYHIEPAYGSEKTTVVVKYPVIGPDIRSQSEVSLWEKASLAAELQYYWSDNAVSVTLTFDPETEAEQVGPVISAFQGKLKAMSFLAIDPNSYPQMPYEAIDESDTQAVAEFDHYLQSLDKIDMSSLYLIAEDAISEKYCTTDSCEI